MKSISISDFNYNLPTSSIAEVPTTPRDHSKLLVYKSGIIVHDQFYNIANQLPNSHLVFNNTKVIPARVIVYTESGAAIEIFLLKPIIDSPEIQLAFAAQNTASWACIVGNKKRWKSDACINVKIDNTLLTIAYINYETNQISFQWSGPENFTFIELLVKIGQIPLPPYIKRSPILADAQSYQTIYSLELGAVAAPTAGLHFTEDTFKSLAAKAHTHQNITLHVGAGTFLPVKTENILDHTMHAEQIIFTQVEIESILKNVDRIIPVGTTSLRSIESLYWFGVKIQHNLQSNSPNFHIEKLLPYQMNGALTASQSIQIVLEFMVKNKFEKIYGSTEILIVPGYHFKLTKGLVTNFHQPQSTLLALISALIGPVWSKVYSTALEQNYRFLSYGDSSLLIP